MQTTLQIGGKPIRLDVYEPRTDHRHAAVVLLHGAGGNTGYWLDRLTPSIAQAGVAVYAIHYFDRTDTIRAEMQMIADGVHVPLWLETIGMAITQIAQRPSVDPGRIALLGISLGAFLSLALATQPAKQLGTATPAIKAIVEISGGLVPPYAANATPAFPPTLILHGDADRIVTVSHAHALDALLTSLNVAHSMHLLRGETHWFTDAAQFRILTETAHFLGKYLYRTSVQTAS